MFHSQALRQFIVAGWSAVQRKSARITLREAGEVELRFVSASVDPISTRNEADANEYEGCAFGDFNGYLWISGHQQLRAFRGVGIPWRLPLSEKSTRQRIVAFRRYRELFHVFGDLVEIQTRTVTVISKSDISHVACSLNAWQTHVTLSLVLKSNRSYCLVRQRIFLLLDWLLTPTLDGMDVDIATCGIFGLGNRVARLLQVPLKDSGDGVPSVPPSV